MWVYDGWVGIDACRWLCRLGVDLVRRLHSHVEADGTTPTHSHGVGLLGGWSIADRLVEVGCQCEVTLLYSSKGAKCG